MTIEKRPNHKPSNKINRSMLKNLSLIALLGIAVVGLPSELSAKNVKVAGTQKGAAAKSITRQVAQQNVTIEFYSPSIVRILKSDAGLVLLFRRKAILSS